MLRRWDVGDCPADRRLDDLRAPDRRYVGGIRAAGGPLEARVHARWCERRAAVDGPRAMPGPGADRACPRCADIVAGDERGCRCGGNGESCDLTFQVPVSLGSQCSVSTTACCPDILSSRA